MSFRFSEDSFEEDTGVFLDENFVLTVYDHERRPFDHPSPSFSQLTKNIQAFLKEKGFSIEKREYLSHKKLDLHARRLAEIQTAELARLERNTWGVHRMIVTEMLGLTMGEEANEADNFLKCVLIPEWRQHLDDFVDRNNALIWFDKDMKRGTQFEKEHDEYMAERKERIYQMVVFVLQRLQIINEQVDKEIRAEKLLEQFGSNGRASPVRGRLYFEENLSDTGSEDAESLFSVSCACTNNSDACSEEWCDDGGHGSAVEATIEVEGSANYHDTESEYYDESLFSVSCACTDKSDACSEGWCDDGGHGSAMEAIIEVEDLANYRGPLFIFPTL